MSGAPDTLVDFHTGLEPRPDEAVPPTLDAFLAAVACGSADTDLSARAADTIRDQSAKDGFLINTSPPPTNKEKERAKARKCVKPQCAKIVEKYLVVYNI